MFRVCCDINCCSIFLFVLLVISVWLNNSKGFVFIVDVYCCQVCFSPTLYLALNRIFDCLCLYLHYLIFNIFSLLWNCIVYVAHFSILLSLLYGVLSLNYSLYYVWSFVRILFNILYYCLYSIDLFVYNVVWFLLIFKSSSFVCKVLLFVMSKRQNLNICYW